MMMMTMKINILQWFFIFFSFFLTEEGIPVVFTHSLLRIITEEKK